MNLNKKMSTRLLIFNVLLILGFSLFGPDEKSLGKNVKLVYLHGAWVLAAEIAFVLAAVFALAGLILFFFGKRDVEIKTLEWSQALGLTGLIYWITYLPLSLLAMETNWNGLFLAEPRFRLALTFALVGVLLQAGLWIMDQKILTAIANIAFIIVLRVVFANAANIMHPPPSPIFNSGNWLIISFFVALITLTMTSAFLLSVLIKTNLFGKRPPLKQ